VDRLGELIARHLAQLLIEPVRLRIPASSAELVASVYQRGQVLRRQETDGVIELIARVPAKLRASLGPYLVA
jgi:hypothetical protein